MQSQSTTLPTVDLSAVTGYAGRWYRRAVDQFTPLATLPATMEAFH